MYRDEELIALFEREAAVERARWTSRHPVSTGPDRFEAAQHYFSILDQIDRLRARPEAPANAA